MKISFDLDDTLLMYGDTVATEPRLHLLWRLFVRDEPLRLGARRLVDELRQRGHEIWIYTSSGRRAGWIRWWLRLHCIRVDGVVDGATHAKCFGEGSLPTKRPHVFGISLHVDNSRGVAIEGERYGFDVCLVEPSLIEWVDYVLEFVKQFEQRKFNPQAKKG